MTVIRDEYTTAKEMLEPYEESEPMMLLLTAVYVPDKVGVTRHCHRCHSVQSFPSILYAYVCCGELTHVQEWQSLGNGNLYGAAID